MSAVILLFSIVILILGYSFYGKFVAGKLRIDPNRPTPSHTMHDGIDYCPAKAPILFGHHFASIAGAAPIVGPIVAVIFGWVPVLLWILMGSVFMGAVHDFSALVASVRHHGRSIGEIIGVNVSRLGKQLFLIFLWATLVIIIAAFVMLVTKVFVGTPSAATASSLFIILAVVFGLTIYKWKAPIWLASLVGVILLAVCMIMGWYFPITLSSNTWYILLIAYIFTASVTPVWILLQPRDYLNSFLLYAVVAAAVAGIFVARPEINLPSFTGWNIPGKGCLFPILFVTVACGAISGLHSIVASGTTAKQLDNERDAKRIGYGAMLVEALVAVIALIMAAALTKGDYDALIKDPIGIFAAGVGSVMSKMGFNAEKSTAFAALAVSAFILTSLDTAARLARFAFQEFFAPARGERPSILNRNRFIGTTVTVAAGGMLAFSNKWSQIWPVFGSANQLLAALALLAISVWLMRSGIKSKFTMFPMMFMFAVTVSALINLAVNSYSGRNWCLFSIEAALIVIALILIVEAARSLCRRTET